MSDIEVQTPAADGGAVRRAAPVFVDRSGRRRRWTVLAGTGMAVGLAASLTLIVMGLLGGSPSAVPGWPDPNGRPRHGDGAVVDLLGGSPSGHPAPASARPAERPAGPASQGLTASSAAVPPSAPAPSPTVTRPGQGTDHRATPTSKVSKSPRKLG